MKEDTALVDCDTSPSKVFAKTTKNMSSVNKDMTSELI